MSSWLTPGFVDRASTFIIPRSCSGRYLSSSLSIIQVATPKFQKGCNCCPQDWFSARCVGAASVFGMVAVAGIQASYELYHREIRPAARKMHLCRHISPRRCEPDGCRLDCCCCCCYTAVGFIFFARDWHMHHRSKCRRTLRFTLRYKKQK